MSTVFVCEPIKRDMVLVDAQPRMQCRWCLFASPYRVTYYWLILHGWGDTVMQCRWYLLPDRTEGQVGVWFNAIRGCNLDGVCLRAHKEGSSPQRGMWCWVIYEAKATQFVCEPMHRIWKVKMLIDTYSYGDKSVPLPAHKKRWMLIDAWLKQYRDAMSMVFVSDPINKEDRVLVYAVAKEMQCQSRKYCIQRSDRSQMWLRRIETRNADSWHVAKAIWAYHDNRVCLHTHKEVSMECWLKRDQSSARMQCRWCLQAHLVEWNADWYVAHAIRGCNVAGICFQAILRDRVLVDAWFNAIRGCNVRWCLFCEPTKRDKMLIDIRGHSDTVCLRAHTEGWSADWYVVKVTEVFCCEPINRDWCVAQALQGYNVCEPTKKDRYVAKA